MGILDVFKKPAQPVQPEVANPPKPIVLIVDDEEFIRDSYMELLSQENLRVLTAANGQEGLNQLRQYIPDLILLDVRMPVMDGIQMFTSMQNDPNLKTIPVIFLTNAGTMQNMELARNYSALGFFIKSNTSPEDVIMKVKDALAGNLGRKKVSPTQAVTQGSS